MKKNTCDKYIINGGKKLYGEINIPKSKNAILPIIAGCILCDGVVVLHKNPGYSDIFKMCDIIGDLGGKVAYEQSDIVLDCRSISKCEITEERAGSIRSSIFSLGSILARLKKAKVAFPGGCEIGTRPIDLHIKGLETLGAKITDRHGYLYCDASNLHSGVVHFDFPSVGATENIMLASTLTKGRTEIFNAAKEPEIVDLQNFLNSLGARIRGAGTSHIVINGVKSLHGGEYTPIPDRIVAGTYALSCIMCGGKVLLKGVKSKHLTSLSTKFLNNSCKIEEQNDNILIESDGRINSIGKTETAPYPGFPTDLQAQMMTALCTANGTSVIVETVFENRFNHVPDLIKMGANITVRDRMAVVQGVKKLYGATVTAHDLRGGASLVMAGLKAEGYTTIENAVIIDRGYKDIDKDFRRLGADIKRIKDE